MLLDTPQRRETRPRDDPAPRRVLTATRFVVFSTIALAPVVAAHWVSWLIVVGALGPTAYVLIAHPESEMSRLRSTLIGHVTAFALGLAAVAAWGGWGHVFTASQRPSLGQGIAVALAVGVLLLVLEVLDAHHPPAAATVLLIASGLVRVGRPLVGLAVSLILVTALSVLLTRFAWPRRAVSRKP